jgi:hypothetical protein
MNRRGRNSLLLLGLLALTGCGDTPDTILRSAINQKNELTDRLMKVTDEESARKFVEVDMKNYADKLKTIDEKWVKWIKDVEDDFRSKKLRLIVIYSNAVPGSEQWRKEADKAPVVDDARVPWTRDAFMTYMKNVRADSDLIKREKARIGKLIQQLRTENPGANPKDLCPNLSKILEPETFNSTLVTGSRKSE